MFSERSGPIAAGRSEKGQGRDAGEPGHVHEARVFGEDKMGVLQDGKSLVCVGKSGEIDQ